ncbi:MAG: DNA mismatch repair endonuclease MutL, partial [Myxococcales bacterium]
MRSIELLSEPVIAGIAAGEVAERPASVVKELVENSLDAGAVRVTVEYDDADGGRIVVTDDGHGIAGDELELAIRPHATSKIRDLSDLDGVCSFGFRGEALASIGAVSKLELVSRRRLDEAGAVIRVEGGNVVDVGAVGARPGTRVTVSDLFGSVPARRKFLKSASAEYSLAADNLRRIALANPGVHLRLLRNGRAAFDFGPVENLAGRLRQVYGRELATAMVEIEARHAGLVLTGSLSPAGVSFGSAKRLSLFVNGRWVHDRALFRALMEAYRTYLVRNRYPAAVLFLEVAPDRVDVNVHPAKAEVRFDDAELVQRFVIESVRDLLRGSASPLGRWGLSADDMERLSRNVPGERRRDAPAARSRSDGRGVPREPSSTHARPATGEEDAELPGYRPTAVEDAGERCAEEQSTLPLDADPTAELPDVLGQVF